MDKLTKLRALFGWTTSPESEFMRIKAVVGILPPLPDASANTSMLAEILKKLPNQVTWDDIHTGRIALVAIMPVAMLQAQYASLADEYEAVTGGRPFIQSVFPNPPKTVDEWRAGVLSLIEDLAKYRRARLLFERVRSIVGMFFGFLILILVLLAFFYAQFAYYNQDSKPPALWQPLLFVGFIGAGFSVLSRLYGLTWTPRIATQIEDIQALKKGLVINCILSMAEGVIAAGAIYLLFSSGLLRGDAFPEFKVINGEQRSVFIQFLAYEPKTIPDVAKLLAWAFIAGFAERLVPDKLKQLAGEASESRANGKG